MYTCILVGMYVCPTVCTMHTLHIRTCVCAAHTHTVRTCVYAAHTHTYTSVEYSAVCHGSIRLRLIECLVQHSMLIKLPVTACLHQNKLKAFMEGEQYLQLDSLKRTFFDNYLDYRNNQVRTCTCFSAHIQYFSVATI